MQTELFDEDVVALPSGLRLLRARTSLHDCQAPLEQLVTQAPFRHFEVPRGGRMSVAMSNAGPWGWTADRQGYRYSSCDPQTGQRWPAIPAAWLALAQRAASDAGYGGFEPDCCLINRYEPGARMGVHRDGDERDPTWPIVSVSLGLPATFVWHGQERCGRGVPLVLRDGDVLVFGGEARLGYHAVRPVRAGGAGGGVRYNLTFRKAG